MVLSPVNKNIKCTYIPIIMDFRWQYVVKYLESIEIESSLLTLETAAKKTQCPLIAVIVSEISLLRAAACYVIVQFLMHNCFYIFLIYISENVKASRVSFVLNSHYFYPFYPFSIGALLGGDLNNSNGGCPSPVRKYSHIYSDHEFDDLLIYCFFFFITKRSSSICIRVFIPNPVQGSSSPLLLCTIWGHALEGSGDATSNINRHAWESLHLPLDM